MGRFYRVTSEELIAKTPPSRPPNWNSWIDILSHSLKGGLRSFTISYLLRGGVNFLIRLFSVFRKKSSLKVAFLQSFFGIETRRFAGMIGVFSFLFKLISNGLFYSRKEHSKRNGAIAGAIAGLAVLIETPENRITISQQFFMRAMQAGKNALKQRQLFSFPHGDTFLFSLAVASIMYAYTMWPATIPKAYYSWIVQHGRVPKAMVELNRANTFTHERLDLDQLVGSVARFHPTIENQERLVKYYEQHHGLLPSIPCCALHPQSNRCSWYCCSVWFKTFLDMLPVYGALNVIPLVVLKTNYVLSEPLEALKRVVRNTAQSCSFLSTYVFIFQSGLCLHRTFFPSSPEPKYLFYCLGAVTGLSILVEQKPKRAELAMYVLPKGLQSLYELAISRGSVSRIPHLDVFGSCAAFSIICALIQKGSALYRI
ncbi:hypothetical protein HDU91_004755 [Kappamyces sp. JEL0680]|nr:hypothetical protein HDU91_004755 [Kappamyces sp. JEL0680]